MGCSSLLDALIAEQRRLDLTDKVFSVKIGLTRSTWNRIRHNRYPLPPRAVQNAVKLFPNLEESATLFLFSRETPVTTGAHKPRRRLEPSNIDAEASERTRTLVLTTDRQTLACCHTETARTEQGTSGLARARSVPRTAPRCYVSKNDYTSEPSYRAVGGEAG